MMQEHKPNQTMTDTATVAGPQSVAAVTPREAPATAPSVLDDEQRETLVGALNRIIPPQGDLPGAGDVGIIETIDRTLAVSLMLRRLIFDGLVEIEIESARQANGRFVDLADDGQDAVLRAVEEAHPDAFVALLDHTYRNYYTYPQVQRAIGHDPRPPQPLGHDLPMFDPTMLERQRQRGPFWRPIE